MHLLDPLVCAWCKRVRAPQFPPVRPEEGGLAVHPVDTGPWPGVEHLSCADDTAAGERIAAELTRHYQASATADAYCQAITGRHRAHPVLRLITGVELFAALGRAPRHSASALAHPSWALACHLRPG